MATTLLQVEKERQQEDTALLKRLHRPIRKVGLSVVGWLFVVYDTVFVWAVNTV